ncbi:unnamed protein product [Allacma fusca]|uniref:t-SNARE coiled-coil homology domain-containing protein n=1 Tax=Allacma fusca TaxID=39272 RepID=A0A8J2P5G1_9HEXA|nr:unnamed protein product [Allacma fusca]
MSEGWINNFAREVLNVEKTEYLLGRRISITILEYISVVQVDLVLSRQLIYDLCIYRFAIGGISVYTCLKRNADLALRIDDMGTSGWATGSTDEESEETKPYNVGQLRTQQYQILEQQDRGLEALSEIISRQKHLATTIGGEVDYQNELIEDITDHVDRTRDRLVGETNRVRTIDRKDNTCGYWVLDINKCFAQD